MPAPFTTPVARSVPFDPSTAAAIAAGISSTTVQDAIIEVKDDAINNDRYPIQSHYAANALVGRYLEIFPGRSSFEAPFIVPENSLIVAYAFHLDAASTGVLRIHNATTAATLLDVSFVNQTTGIQSGLQVGGISAGDLIQVFIYSGSLMKPHGFIWFQTNT